MESGWTTIWLKMCWAKNLEKLTHPKYFSSIFIAGQCKMLACWEEWLIGNFQIFEMPLQVKVSLIYFIKVNTFKCTFWPQQPRPWTWALFYQFPASSFLRFPHTTSDFICALMMMKSGLNLKILWMWEERLLAFSGGKYSSHKKQ